MLRELQLAFLEAVSQSGAAELLPITPKKRLQKEELIFIYRDSSHQGVINSLKSIYSVCAQMLGMPKFDEISRSYIGKVKSVSPNINDYGSNFPEFIRNYPDIDKKEYIEDMAKLEWLCHSLSRAPLLSPNLDFTLLNQALEGEADIRFELLPSVETLYTEYALYTLWHSYQPFFKGKKLKPSMEKKPEHLLIFRSQNDLCLYRIENSLWFVVDRMKKAKSVGEIINESEQNGVILDLSAILPTILRENWIFRFQLLVCNH